MNVVRIGYDRHTRWPVKVDIKESGLRRGLEHREFVGELSDC